MGSLETAAEVDITARDVISKKFNKRELLDMDLLENKKSNKIYKAFKNFYNLFSDWAEVKIDVYNFTNYVKYIFVQKTRMTPLF
jgi:hypothetical protein